MTDINVNTPDIVKGWLLFVAVSFGFVAGFMFGVLLVVIGGS
jgi:hypothetical protein